MSRAKEIGTAAETAVVTYLRNIGLNNVFRVVLHGKDDVGDVHIGSPDCPDYMFEVKSRKHSISEKEVNDFFNEVRKESNNLYGQWEPSKSFLVVKKPGKGKAQDWDCYFEVRSPGVRGDNIIVRGRFGDVFKES